MARDIEDPITVPDGRDGTRTTHPAFGCIRLTNTQGQATMFGSDFQHRNYVSIEVCESSLRRSLSRDWHFGENTLIRLRMSHSQWAAFVSSAGLGEGIQCTLETKPAPGAPLFHCPDFPLRDENDEFDKEGSETLKDVVRHLSALEAKVRDATSGIPKKKADVLLGEIEGAKRALTDSFPFVEKSFRQRMERRVSRAKTEVFAWANAMIVRRGLAAIAEDNGTPIQIEDKRPVESP